MWFLNLLLIFLCFSLLGAETMKIQFDDIAGLVEERNHHVKGATLIKESAEAGQGFLKRSYLPHVEAKIGSERFQSGTQLERSEPYGKVEATVNVFRGGIDKLENNLVDTRIKASSAEADQSKREEIKKARLFFWQLVSSRELEDLLVDAIAENQKNLTSAQKRVREGLATQTDRIDFEMRKIELNQDVARLKLSAQNMQRQLRVLLGLSEGAEIMTSNFVDHNHDDKMLTSSYQVENHPSLTGIRFRADEALLKGTQLSRWWAPSIDLYAEYGTYTFREREFDPSSERAESVFGARVTIQIFDKFTMSTEASQKNLEAAGLQSQHLQSVKELQADVENAKAELKLNHDLIHESEDALKLAKTFLTRTLDEYRRGVKNSPDVLSATSRNLEMRKRFAELRRDYQVARTELLSVLGK